MIESLYGIHEIVNYKDNDNIKLYENTQATDYPSHWHTPIEIIMPIENSYSIVCNNRTLEVKPNEIILIGPGVIHMIKAPSSGKRIILQAEISPIKEIKEINSVLSFISPVALITPENSPNIHEALRSYILEICYEYSKETTMSEAIIYSKLINMFVLIGRNHTNNLNPEGMNQLKQQEYIEKFFEICEYINTHYTEELNLEQLSEMANFSKYHFSRLFKQFTNISFYKYVNQKRIAHAEELLINPNIPITEVAIQSGFSSLSSFIRMFKIMKGCTPTDFRKIYRQA